MLCGMRARAWGLSASVPGNGRERRMGKQSAEFLVTMLLRLLAAAPFVVAGCRSPAPPGRWKMIGLAVLVLVLTTGATSLDSIFGWRQPDWLHWNWIGKLAAVAMVVLLELTLP